MDGRGKLIDILATVRTGARSRIVSLIDEILSLAWEYRAEGFAFENFPQLDAQVNKVLADFSDGNLADAEKKLRELLESLEWGDFADDALEYAENEKDNQNALFRFDMHASHLKEIIAVWLGVAFVGELSKTETARQIWGFWGSPELSPKWVGVRSPFFHWGKGYTKNILGGIIVLEQDIINSAYQFAVLQDFSRQGAIGYKIRRGSNYDCPYCDEHCGILYPLGQQILPLHSRCLCIAYPVFSNE